MLGIAAVVAGVLAAVAGLFAAARKILNRGDKHIAQAVIRDPEEHTTLGEDGATRSIQGADLTLPEEELSKIWSPMYLERLARTYWRFLSKSTGFLVSVRYRDDGRDVVALGFIPLLTFQAPEYEMDADRGIVRWRIDKGVLVAGKGRGGKGYLELDVRRCPSDEPGRAKLHVEVEVANFYPAIASRVGQWVYANTQSRIHVIVTHGFLRSLARLDLAESKVGRFATPHPDIDDVPDVGDRGTPLERVGTPR